MWRLTRSIGALLLAVTVCAGVSAGPAFGDTSAPTEPTTTEPTTPEPTTTQPTEPEPTEPEPTETEPNEPTHVEPAVPAEPAVPGEVADPVVVEPGEGTVDLTISAAFIKPAYFVDEIIVARARVTNTGTGTASQVELGSTGNLTSHYWWWDSSGSMSIGPGETAEGTLFAYVTGADDPLITLEVTARSYESDVNPADNTVTVTVPVSVVRGSYKGVVYADRNGNVVMDSGEELTGLTVTVTGGRPYVPHTTTTDLAGRFVFDNLPRGRYSTNLGAGEWSFDVPAVEVDGEDDPDLVYRGANWIDRVLTASMALDRQSYQVGDTARLTLSLTNRGSAPIPGLIGSCWSTSGPQPDFGDLARGVTMPANGTWTLGLSTTVDHQAFALGYMRIGCSFGTAPGGNTSVSAEAIAQVPGAIAEKVSGTVTLMGTWFPPGFGHGLDKPVPDLKVYLGDPVTGAVVARATTNAEGVFEFYNVPVGVYGLGVVGPWSLFRKAGSMVFVRLGPPAHYHFFAIPGPDRPDPDAPPPGGPPAPAPVPGAGPGQPPAQLALTGVNVSWLALGGLLTLLAGVGLMFRPRRKGF